MNAYVVLVRGINVGGKNKVPMAQLRQCLTDLGFSNVSTYIASGNVILSSNDSPEVIKQKIEAALPKHFSLDSELIKVLVLSYKQLAAIVKDRPKGFGDQPETYYSDVIFLIDVATEQAMAIFDPRGGVDAVWAGKNVVYSQRLGELRAKSRLSKIVGTPAYKSMTIRSWNTTVALLKLLKAAQE